MTISVLEKLCCQIPWCQRAILESTLELALEIAREGREGRRIGTLFTLGKADDVLDTSRPLILDPLAGHAPGRTHITDPDLRGTIKELAQLDGAFVISDAGTVVAACRYLDASVEQIELPLGLGSRHLAAASVSQRLGAIAIVVSESGVVRVFHQGRLEASVIPELWLLDRHNAQLGRHDVKEQHRSVDVLTVSVGPMNDEARIDAAGAARGTRGETTHIRLTS
jgi:DNA integrity scanning protein DisA with diadenylate cyclase activity